ncbi:hypothetical protein AAHC03_026694 [Spirometra sp. Aus1]
MQRIIRRKLILPSIGVCCLLLYLLSTLFQRDTTVKKIPFDAHLKTFCENLNDSTQPLPDYQTQYPHETDVFFANMSSPSHENCQRFRWAFVSHEGSPVAAQEAAYPLAFTIVAHRSVRQLARLLRMIHRPANFYCIHIDRRSSAEFSQAVEGVATCFGPNVHVVPPASRVAVVWGNASVLKPQLVCAEAALRQSGWRYLLNLVGEEVPLRTNLEMIAAMQALNGSNLLEGFRGDRFIAWTKGIQLPDQMKWFKGSLYGAFRREFLKFALHSPKSRPLLDAVMSDKEVLHPDELFFQTLAFNAHLGAPGACLNIPLPTEVNEGYPGRYYLWGDRHTFCPTKYVRGVCILGSPHVPKMRHSHHLFANKMHADYYPEAYDCMEQWYFQRLHREWQHGGIDQEAFVPGEYMGLTCSKYHVH